MIGAENLDLVANGWSLHRTKMSEEAFSALRVGLFGICSGYALKYIQISREQFFYYRLTWRAFLVRCLFSVFSSSPCSGNSLVKTP